MRSISLLIFAVPTIPWLLFLVLSQIKSLSGILSGNLSLLLLVLAVPLFVSVILFWYKAIFLTKAVRLYMRGLEVAGVVFNNRHYAEQAAALNSRELTKVSFLKGL